VALKMKEAKGTPISMDLLKQLGELAICKNTNDLSHCINSHMIGRESIERAKGKRGNQK